MFLKWKTNTHTAVRACSGKHKIMPPSEEKGKVMEMAKVTLRDVSLSLTFYSLKSLVYTHGSITMFPFLNTGTISS